MAKIMSLREKYEKEVVSALAGEFQYASGMQIPQIEKVSVNIGVGRLHKETKEIEEMFEEAATITGQKLMETQAKKAIAGFKVRQGATVGGKVTLRKQRMWNFLDRLVHVALPRTRDFQGIPVSSVDSYGNMNIGMRDHSIFPEMKPEKLRRTFGMQITVTTTAKSREEGLALFRKLGFPLQKSEQQ